MARLPLLDRLALLIAQRHARSNLDRFFKCAAVARATQARVLREKIARNGTSEFAVAHRIDSIRSPAEFASRIPVQTYESLSPYVEKAKQGQPEAILGRGQRLLMFALTSGTTCEPKFIPVTSAFLDEYRRGWNCWGLRALIDHPGCFLRHIVQVSSPMNDFLTPTGVPCGAITGLMAATQKRLVRRYYTAPLELAAIKDSTSKYYAIMRLAVPRDVAFLISANPATLLQLARTANEHREALIRDVHDGALASMFEIPAEVRAQLVRRLKPDPPAARRLERLAKEHGALRPQDYWSLGFIAHWTGGTMGLYRQRFAEWFGEIPVRDPGLLASEGRISVPIDDNTPAGLLDVTSHYFEFIPAAEYGTGNCRALTIDQLCVGEEYFVLLTTSSGFFRYDIGDRVRVTGFLGQAPIIEFLSKGAHTSSLAGEKLTEHQVIAAMRLLKDAAENFVLAPVFADPPYYRLYVETARTPSHLARDLDDRLALENIEYASKRRSNRLGTVVQCMLPPGTLARADQRLRAMCPGRAEQFKHRYLLPECGLDEELQDACEPRQPAGV